jgi:hypothetical protein
MPCAGTVKGRFFVGQARDCVSTTLMEGDASDRDGGGSFAAVQGRGLDEPRMERAGSEQLEGERRDGDDAPISEMEMMVSFRETEYTDNGCCRMEPFCEAHGSKPGAEFFLVRVGAAGKAAASVYPDGVRVRDSWSLGGLTGLHNLPLRFLISAQVEQRKGAGSGSSSPLSSSDGWSGESTDVEADADGAGVGSDGGCGERSALLERGIRGYESTAPTRPASPLLPRWEDERVVDSAKRVSL